MDVFFQRYEADFEQLLAQVQLVLFMVGMGATLTPTDFKPVFGQPTRLAYGLAFQLVVTPIIAVLVSWVAGLGPGLAVGLLLVGSLPGGTLSNAYTHLSRCNVALSIALSATATLLAIVTIPLSLRFLVGYSVGPENQTLVAELEIPVWGTIKDILYFMLVPLGLGMLIEHYAPHHKERVSRICLILGFSLLAVMVVGSIGAKRIEVGKHGWGGPLIIIAFCLITQQLSMLFIRFTSWPRKDWVAVGIEATIRNVYLGILLATSLKPPPNATPEAKAVSNQIMFVVLFYGPAALIGALPLALRMRRHFRNEAEGSHGSA